MKLGFVRVIALVFSLSVLTTAMSTNAHAQSSASPKFGVIPATIDTGVKPGQTTNKTITVKNFTNAPLTISLGVTEFPPQQDVTDPEQLERFRDGVSWVTVPKQATVAANTSQPVTVAITPPQDASTGGHYALIVLKPVTTSNGGASSVGQVGVRVFMTVPGGRVEKLQVTKTFSTSFFHLGGPIILQGEVQNVGNTHVALQGPALLKGNLEISKHPIGLEETEGIVLAPGEKRIVTLRRNEGLLGTYFLAGNLTYGIGNKQKLPVSSDRFVSIPPLFLIGVVVIVLAGFIVWSVRRGNPRMRILHRRS